MPLKGLDEMNKELSVLAELSKKKYASKADAEKELRKLATKKGISPSRIEKMCKGIEEKK